MTVFFPSTPDVADIRLLCAKDRAPGESLDPHEVERLVSLVIQLLDDPNAFDDWLNSGIAAGWCGPPVCSTHDGIPTSAAEDDRFEEYDPCVHVLRLYESAEVKAAVEANHSPSVWRAANRQQAGTFYRRDQ